MREGLSTGGAFRLLLTFSFTLALGGGGSLMSTSGVGETCALAFGFMFVFSFAAGLIAPPEGIPSSLLPVGDSAGVTG